MTTKKKQILEEWVKGTRTQRIWKRWMSLLRKIVLSGITTLRKVDNIS